MKYLLQTAIVLTIATPTWASDSGIPCGVADELAVKAYKRVKQAMAAKRQVTAAVASQSFWDIESYAANCPGVSQRAKDLTAAGFTKNLDDPLAEGPAKPVSADTVSSILKGSSSGKTIQEK